MKHTDATGTKHIAYAPKQDPMRTGQLLAILTPTAREYAIGEAYATPQIYEYAEPTQDPAAKRVAQRYMVDTRRPSILAEAPSLCATCAAGQCDDGCREIADLGKRILNSPCPCECFPDDTRAVLRVTYPRRVCPKHGEGCILSRCLKHSNTQIVWYCKATSEICPTCLREAQG